MKRGSMQVCLLDTVQGVVRAILGSYKSQPAISTQATVEVGKDEMKAYLGETDGEAFGAF